MVLAMLALPWIKVPAPGLVENRTTTVWPGWPHTTHELAELPSRVDAYIQDHFPPRKHFIGWLNYLRYTLGYSGLTKVIVGHDGWLFFNQGHVFYHMGIARLTPDQLKTWAKRFQMRQTSAAAEGSSLFLLIAPEKPSVYPEKLPGWVQTTRNTEVLDMIKAVTPDLRERIIYPLNNVLQAKAEQPVYGPYDTHWNGFGGYAAYSALMQAIHNVEPTIEGPLPLSTFTLNTERRQLDLPHDMVGMIGIANLVDIEHPTFSTVPQHDLNRTLFLTEDRDWWNSQVIETDSVNNRTLLLVRDSFSAELLPFLKPHFKTIVLAHGWDGYNREDLIKRFKPDVVVIETIETGARVVFGAP